MSRKEDKKRKLDKEALHRELREWRDAFIVAIILAIIIRTFAIEAFRIPTGSMRMTLIEKDRLFVNKLKYGAKVPFMDNQRLPGYGKPERGDIIVFVYPGLPKKDYIKRLIAKGGETVEIKFGDIYIDGKLIEDPVIKDTYYYNDGSYGEEEKPVRVPEGHYYVLGDNSLSSQDSRFWGFVPEDNMIGKAVLIYWPLNRIRIVK